jgi:hypothetical protein
LQLLHGVALSSAFLSIKKKLAFLSAEFSNFVQPATLIPGR